jgi:hypothetical protein
MKTLATGRTARTTIVIGATFLAGAARAQNQDADEFGHWFARANAVARFNIKATVERSNPSSATGVFNNGYVLPDATPGGASTSNWGYNDASQVVGGNIVFNRYDYAATGGKQTLFDDPAFGGEVVGGYRFNDFILAEKKARISLQAGYGYTSISQGSSFGANGTVTYSTSSHALDTPPPPPAPYSGSALGGPKISVASNGGTTVTSASATSFQGDFDASFHTIRVGAGFEMDLTKKFTAEFGLGCASVITDASLKYTEVQTFTDASIPTVNTTRNVDHNHWDAGFYVELLAVYKFTDHLGAFLGADYQYITPVEFGDATHKVKIDLSSTYAAKAGVTLSF